MGSFADNDLNLSLSDVMFPSLPGKSFRIIGTMQVDEKAKEKEEKGGNGSTQHYNLTLEDRKTHEMWQSSVHCVKELGPDLQIPIEVFISFLKLGLELNCTVSQTVMILQWIQEYPMED